MRFAIIYSKKNIAGVNIVEEFKKLGFTPQIPIVETTKQTIFLKQEDLKKYPKLDNVDFLVFASTHKSETCKPSLSLHAPGNWRGADLGGEEGKVSMTSAYVLKYLFQQLDKNAKNVPEIYEKYQVTLECTHHGPSINIPCAFIELGSSEKQWKDNQAARVVAKTILSLQDYKPGKWIASLGIGGPHYCPNFNKIQLNSQYAISHVVPQYSLPLTQSMLQEAEKKTKEHIKEIIIDWKGSGKSEERAKYLKIIQDFGISLKRTSEIEK